MHHIGSLASLAAKVLAKEVSDIGFIINDQVALCADPPRGKLTLMMPPLPLSSGECGAIER
jgi:hypothetical protein